MARKIYNYDNKYSLLNYDCEDERPEMSDVKKVTEEVDALIKDFISKYKAIGKKYPNAGIGDTATDECVVENLYGPLHFGEKV